MSFFYLTAVKGDIPVHLLEIIAFERLRYLKSVLQKENSIYNQYLVEGSLYDNVGHFLLCIMTIMCKDMHFNSFLLKTERDLFMRRLDALNAYELRCFSKKLHRSIRKLTAAPIFIDGLQLLCEHMMLKELAQHICTPNHSYNCIAHSISLNFKLCLPFIARRQIELQNGKAYIPCGKWKHFLTILYSRNLKYRLDGTNLYPLNSDSRISELLMKFKKEIGPLLHNNGCSKDLLSNDVNHISLQFPPCMLHLHQQLRKRHRLSHTQRFYYSLFLKDIGMPIDEAIEFWRCEYRQTPNGSHSCCHHWDRDEKKYLYGIRHMYGLEGCRKSYTSVNCQRIQDIESSCSEGGCPFKIFDAGKMLHILNLTETDPLWTQVNELKSRHHYTAACIKYLNKSLVRDNEICDIESFNFTPVKYYTYASKKNDVI